MARKILNYINGTWREEDAKEHLDVVNSATQELLGQTPLFSAPAVESVEAAAKAYSGWRGIPPGDRVQPLFRLKYLLEDNLDSNARTITSENGNAETYRSSIPRKRCH